MSAVGVACIGSSIGGRPYGPGRSAFGSEGRFALLDIELAAECRDRPELETANGSFLFTHCLGGFPGREPGEEAQGDGFSLLVRQRRQGRLDRVELLADDDHLVGTGIPARLFHHGFQIGVVVARPDEVDDRVPGQPEEPAPERDTSRLVAGQGLQDLDEDELRQVLRVRRALDAAGDETMDRLVVVIEDQPECPGIPRPGFGHESLDRGVVDGHNDGLAASLGPDRIRNRSGRLTASRSPPRRNASSRNPAAAATPYPASRPDAKASFWWASDPAEILLPPSTLNRATTAPDGYVSPAA